MKALYRKYRPSSFDEVLGQDNIVTVLQQAVSKNDLVHAYLFSGSRGTGKTSVARIFASEIGCDPADVFEIDVASHTGVEDIRALNEMVHIYPLKSKHKVYILDEVHMFSKAAFNAFLKTLEEPPSHVIFVLATTEPEKIPDTVLSRCQSFLFKKPNNDLLAARIEEVLKKEGYSAEKDVPQMIALLSGESFRDALGILQKVLLATPSKEVKKDFVENLLGVPDSAVVTKYITSFIKGDVAGGISALEEVKGHDMIVFCTLAVDALRALILYKKTNEKKDVVENFDEKTSKEEGCSLENLLVLLDAYAAIPYAHVAQLPLEVALFRASEK